MLMIVRGTIYLLYGVRERRVYAQDKLRFWWLLVICVITVLIMYAYSAIAIMAFARIPLAWIFRARRIRWPLPAARAHPAASHRIFTAIRPLPVIVQTRRLHQLADHHFNIPALRHRPLIRHAMAVLYEVALLRTGKKKIKR